jgi:hypothetical protein
LNVISQAGEQTLVHRFLDTAADLVCVRAVGKPAACQEGTQLDEVRLHFFRSNVPQLHLANARRVDDPTSSGQRQQFGHSCCMTSLARLFRDLGGFEGQPRLQGVEQRRLADSALPGERGFATAQQHSQALHPLPRERTAEEDFASQSRVQANDRLQSDRIGQIGLVDTDNGPDSSLRRTGDEPIN